MLENIIYAKVQLSRQGRVSMARPQLTTLTMGELDSNLLPCTDENCNSTFKDQKALNNHVNDYHKLEHVVNFKKDKGKMKY